MSSFYTIQDAYSLLKHPEKYKGTRPITLRSGWEISFVTKYLDVNKNILEWSSETTVIPYICGTDGKQHRYFMDFTAIAKTTSGGIKELWIEIKPKKQTIPPTAPKRNTKGYAKQVATYIKNTSKWTATEKLCEQARQIGKSIEFVILTEIELKGII